MYYRTLRPYPNLASGFGSSPRSTTLIGCKSLQHQATNYHLAQIIFSILINHMRFSL